MARKQVTFRAAAREKMSEALATLVVNRLRGVLACVAVKAPGFGERRKATTELPETKENHEASLTPRME